MAIYGLGAWLAGLEGINPENIGKVAVYPVSDLAVTTIKYAAVFVIIPVSLIAVVLAGINMRLKKNLLNQGLTVYLCLTIVWLFFISWVLSATYVDSSEAEISSPSSNKFELEEDSSFKTQIIQFE